MAVPGVFASDSGIIGDRRGDFAAGLLQVMPTGTAQLLALSSGMENAGASDTVIHWFEENHLSGRINVTNNAGTGTSFIVSDSDFAQVGTIFLVESTGEHVLVTGISGTTLTIVRGFAGTTITALDGSSTAKPIQRIGTAFEEGSAKPVATANLGYPRFNYMEIFRNAWDVTGTARAVEWHTGNVVAKNRRDGMLFHSEDIERAFWFSKKTVGVQNNKPFRTMDGIDAQLLTNRNAQSTNVNYTDVITFIESVFERNIKGKPNERIAFCGNTVLRVIDYIVMSLNSSSMNLQPGQTNFGMRLTKWQTPFGDISLMTHPLFNENALWTKYLYILHPGAIRLRWLRRTHEDTNDKDGTRAGADADFGVWTSEVSIEYKAEVTGGVYTGIDTAATDGTIDGSG